MSLVHAPLTAVHGESSMRVSSTTRAMEVGQHLIAVALTTVGAIRALTDGSHAAWVILAALVLLGWHTVGTLLPVTPQRRSLAPWWLAGFAVVWIAAVVVSAEFVWVAFLLWLLAGHLLPLVGSLVFSIGVFAVVIIAPVVHHGTTSYANVLGPLIGGVFALGISRGYLQLLNDAAERERLLASLTQAQHDMAALQDELALTQRHSGVIAERTRISRDIHDTVAQSLSSMKLIANAERSKTTDATAAHTLSRIELLAGESLADVRRIVAALAPTELENSALASALQRILDRATDETGLTTRLNVDQTLPALPTEVEVALLRVAQSALANVQQHSQATRVVMSLIDAEDTVRLDIIDDGAGFDVLTWDRQGESTPSSSYGLRFMRTRLRELGGGLDIESTPGESTALSAHLPIFASREAHL